jgi:glycosyltransferase involved in cell wall biosynthesis
MSQADSNTPPPISVLILTRNEQANIADCLRSLAWCDDVVVLDSESTDDTAAIARTFANVRVVTRAFDTEYRQRNFGLHDMTYRHPWLYICDADERVPADLAAELRSLATSDAPHVAYRLRYRNMFGGRWIRHATSYPVWIIRFVRPGKVTYEQRQTNVHPIVDGSVGEIAAHFDHFSFNSGIGRWFSKHNYYSTREAAEAVRIRQGGRPKVTSLLRGDPMRRRRAAKNLSFFLPLRGLLRFVWSFVVRGGWLDGTAGLHYCLMIAVYEYWIEVKIREIEQPWRKRTDDVVARRLSEGAS